VTNIGKIGDGHIIHGDGGVYQRVKFDALMFKPELQEIVQGTVCEILKFGAFIRFGPLDGLLHISQIMDDRIDIDEGGNRLVGKDTKREIRIGDDVRARIVAISMNERSPRESKIGLTMRQPGLGKIAWLEEERGEGKGTKKAPKEKKPKK
jgi:DNA-directed RNA polymerase subunit E'